MDKTNAARTAIKQLLEAYRKEYNKSAKPKEKIPTHQEWLDLGNTGDFDRYMKWRKTYKQ